MFLSSRNDVILIVLTLLLHSATSQRLQENIEQLPECSSNCIAAAATAAGCAADDFACQCQKSNGIFGAVESVLGSVVSQNKCLVGDCGILSAGSAQALFRQICGLFTGTTSSFTPPAPESTPLPAEPLAEPIAAPPEVTTPPAPVNTPESEPTVDFTAPPADPMTTEQPPNAALSTFTSQPIVQSTSIPVFTLPPYMTTSIPPPPPTPTPSSSVPPSSTSIPITSSSVPASSAPAMQTSLPSSLSSFIPSTLISSTSSVALATPPAFHLTTSITRLLPSTSPTSASYQVEANQSVPTVNAMPQKRMSPAIIGAIVLSVLSFVTLCTFIFILLRRRQQVMEKKRAMSTMTVGSRKSGGEEITVYLDLGEEGGMFGGGGGGSGGREVRGSKRVVFGDSGGERANSTPLNVPPSQPMVGPDKGFDFRFGLGGGS